MVPTATIHEAIDPVDIAIRKANNIRWLNIEASTAETEVGRMELQTCRATIVLKYSTLDREIARRQKALSRIKKHLVRKDYDSSSIWSAASSQICRGLRQTTAQSQACRAMMAGPPLTDWLCSTPVARGELKKIIWIKPTKSRDPYVSNIALESVNALRMSDEVPQGLPISEGAPVIIHSVH